MDCPHNATELCMFIGCVNYYRDMWPSCAHILKPLTDQSGLKKRAPIEWTDEMQQAFDRMRLLMAADALAAYPDHNKWFHIYTDASDFQLGACIIQEGRPVAYFSQKLTKSQQNYATMEKEMLFIIATLEEFQSMLLGANIPVVTDHKNLTFDTLKTQHVLRWHTKIKEFSPMPHDIKGPCNILADNLSRTHRLVTPAQIAEGKKLVEPAEVSIEEEDEAYFLDQKYSGLYNENVWECIERYLNLPATPHPDENPLNYAHIHELQQQDKQLLALQVKYPAYYVNLQLDDNVNDIICYKKNPTQPNWKVALPESMVVDTVKWFHQVMGHPGEKRLQDMLNQCYHHPKLRYHIDTLKCKDCQKYKLAGRGYGLLPKQELRIAPWEEVAINLIGPWKVKVNGQQVEFNALTCIDMASNLVKLIRIDNKTAKHIRDKFTKSWLC
jgi:hypothetical protein